MVGGWLVGWLVSLVSLKGYPYSTTGVSILRGDDCGWEGRLRRRLGRAAGGGAGGAVLPGGAGQLREGLRQGRLPGRLH